MLRFAALLPLACALFGCSSMSASDMAMAGGGYQNGGNFGATQGGVQDMTFARDLLKEGKVPPPEAFTVEAMFSEHDLPLAGGACQTTLCLRSAMGVAPDASGDPEAWVQVGMSSNIDPAAFKRPSLAVVATVDISGSMGWGYGQSQITGGSISHAILRAVASKLGPADRFALVTYGSSASEPLGWTAGDSPSIASAIDALHSGGSTNMEAGLKLAFKVAHDAKGSADQTRVMLFTDMQPNVGATSPSAFEQMAGTAADDDVGLTVFGVGLGLGAEVMKSMSQLRGGNAFSVMDPDKVPAFMQDNWPWLASPIAYNLHLDAQPEQPLSLLNSYGFPGDGGTLDVATVFLSKKKGGLLLELSPGDTPLHSGTCAVDLSWMDAAGQSHKQSLDASYNGQTLDESGSYLPQQGLARAVPLALLVTAMHDAAEQYSTSPTQAIATLKPALARFTKDASGDPDLEAEAQFWVKLLDLMQQGAAQGNFYP